MKYVFVSYHVKYQVEVPASYNKPLPKDFDNTSKSKGNKRYQDDRIKDLEFQLEVAHDDLRDQMEPFVHFIFTKFYNNRLLLQEAV